MAGMTTNTGEQACHLEHDPCRRGGIDQQGWDQWCLNRHPEKISRQFFRRSERCAQSTGATVYLRGGRSRSLRQVVGKHQVLALSLLTNGDDDHLQRTRDRYGQERAEHAEHFDRDRAR